MKSQVKKNKITKSTKSTKAIKATKVVEIKVRLEPNVDPTSAKLHLDPNGESLIKTVRNNKYKYYQLVINNDQIGLSKMGKHWNVVPSKHVNDKQFEWFGSKLKWCIKHHGFDNNNLTQVQAILNKYIKFVELKIFA